ncbi:MAG: hypothetical protein QOG23_4436 [Blastocatellia bacterium]|jgi:hypothetical protein|nr:hypothetical protein [Blastocatellia bacterium]
MPDNPTQLWRQIIEGVAVKFLIAATVGAGGIVLTWLTARSGYSSGQPFYRVAPYIGGVFWPVSFIFSLTISRIERRVERKTRQLCRGFSCFGFSLF